MDNVQTPTKSTSNDVADEIRTAIAKCKESILKLDNASEERKLLVRELINLRITLQDIDETGGEAVKTKTIQGHKFVSQGLTQIRFNTSQLFCEICGSLIWLPLQSWSTCTDCELIAHEHCLENVKRNCVALLVDRNPSYIMKICPEGSLSLQGYKCQECRNKLSFSCKTSQPILCDYTGNYYCGQCHWNHEALIPARIVLNWDFSMYPVSRASEQYLKLMINKPLINLELQNPRLFGFVEELALVQKLRSSLVMMKEYILTCRDALDGGFLYLIREHKHFFDDPYHYTIKELREIREGTLPMKLEDIHHKYTLHIMKECLSCRGKGHVCRLCGCTPEIFPFENHVTKCHTCHAVYHKECYKKKDSVCPKCLLKG